MEPIEEIEDGQLRLLALQLAAPQPAQSEPAEDVIVRAEVYLDFLKGTN